MKKERGKVNSESNMGQYVSMRNDVDKHRFQGMRLMDQMKEVKEILRLIERLDCLEQAPSNLISYGTICQFSKMSTMQQGKNIAKSYLTSISSFEGKISYRNSAMKEPQNFKCPDENE